MKLFDKEITAINEDDLQELCDEKFGEARIVEYKAQLNFTTNEDREKVLSQISSFANANGGHLIYGIKANAVNKSEPESVLGQAVADPDGLVLQIEQTARHGIRPQIPFFETQPIRLKSGNYAFVFRIPQSWNRPHQLVLNNKYQFYSRSSNGRTQIDVDELRNLFVNAADLRQRIENFRVTRISDLIAGNTPIGEIEPPLIALHSVSITNFAKSEIYAPTVYNNIVGDLMPVGLNLANRYFNFDGFVITSTFGGKPMGYTQIYRDSRIEMVRGDFLGANSKENRLIPQAVITRLLLNAVKGILQSYQKTNASLPLLLMVTLIGVKGYKVVNPDDYDNAVLPIDRDVLQFPAIFVDDLNVEASKLLYETFNIFWQTGGHGICPYYDDEGNWIEGKRI